MEEEEGWGGADSSGGAEATAGTMGLAQVSCWPSPTLLLLLWANAGEWRLEFQPGRQSGRQSYSRDQNQHSPRSGQYMSNIITQMNDTVKSLVS